MLVLNIVKWGMLLLLVFTCTAQIFLYIRVRKYFDKLPIVVAEITHSELLNYNDVTGARVWEARIKFKYAFCGKEYESSTPALRSPQIFGPTWEFDSELVKNNKVGDIVNVRVVPNCPELAYITVAPFSFWSAVLLPIITILYALFILGYFWWISVGIKDIYNSW